AARTLEVYWTYQTSSCGAPPPSKDTSSKSAVGGHLLASGPLEDGDYSLVLLRDVPNGVTFSGWDLGDPPLGGALVGLHHPTGSWKRISFGERVTSFTAAVGDSLAPAARYLDVLWDKGRVEPGSSGSPLFSSPGIIVGALTYGPVSESLSACQVEPSVAGYGRFSNTYGYIKDFLENLPAAVVLPDKPDVSFTVANRAAPAGQSIRLTTQSAGEVTFKLRADAPWISLSAASGVASAGNPAVVTIGVDPAQLSRPERYASTVTILSGAAPPQFVNVAAVARVDRSNVAVSISPNPAYQSDGLWTFKIRLSETAGAATRVTAVLVNGIDYSEFIRSWFGTDKIEANGTAQASLRAAGLPPGEQYFEFRGADEASGEQWYRVSSATFR
ncbi:MAG: hypothetical protein LAQ30_23250, partial [Acidobacteriia bacterium]|nr:hypothetical protein [Terriglobia bacterium]